jgi:hypothetical protein
MGPFLYEINILAITICRNFTLIAPFSHCVMNTLRILI